MVVGSMHHHPDRIASSSGFSRIIVGLFAHRRRVFAHHRRMSDGRPVNEL
jgi:hypothetical protein